MSGPAGPLRALAALVLGLAAASAACGLRPAPPDGPAASATVSVSAPGLPAQPAPAEDPPMAPIEPAPLAPQKNHASDKVAAKRSTLALRHLRLKPGASLVRTYGIRKQPHDVLLLGERQAALQSADRGHFFEDVASADAARELFFLAYPGAVILKDAADIARVRAALEAQGWTKDQIPVPEPPWTGVAIEAAKGGSFRVRALLIRHSAGSDLGLRGVVAVEGSVARDGRVGVRETVCVTAPESPYGVPPTWKQPLPLGPSAYNRVLRAATPGAPEVRDPVTVTHERLSVPCPANVSARWYQNDYDRWP